MHRSQETIDYSWFCYKDIPQKDPNGKDGWDKLWGRYWLLPRLLQEHCPLGKRHSVPDWEAFWAQLIKSLAIEDQLVLQSLPSLEVKGGIKVSNY